VLGRRCVSSWSGVWASCLLGPAFVFTRVTVTGLQDCRRLRITPLCLSGDACSSRARSFFFPSNFLLKLSLFFLLLKTKGVFV
jgi:hypothetical protein